MLRPRMSSGPAISTRLLALAPCCAVAACGGPVDRGKLVGRRFAHRLEEPGRRSRLHRRLQRRRLCLSPLCRAAPQQQDAIEAEATAQLLTKNTAEGLADDLVVTYDVRDFDALLARFEADPRCEQTEIDPQDFEGETPPQVIYALLDRAPLTDASDLSREAIPQVLAETLFFAAEGDDPPRLELEVFRPQLAAAEALLREVAGDTLGDRENEEVVDRMSAVELALSCAGVCLTTRLRLFVVDCCSSSVATWCSMSGRRSRCRCSREAHPSRRAKTRP